jgi:hypothetical protein
MSREIDQELQRSCLQRGILYLENICLRNRRGKEWASTRTPSLQLFDSNEAGTKVLHQPGDGLLGEGEHIGWEDPHVEGPDHGEGKCDQSRR